MSPADTSKRYNRYDFPWKFFLLIIFLIGAIPAYYMVKSLYHDYKLSSEGKDVLAEISGISMSPWVDSKDGNVAYRYMVDGEFYYDHIFVKYSDDNTEVICPNGMPLEKGDRFICKYLPDDPKVNRLDFDRPDSTTVRRYLSLAANSLLNAIRAELGAVDISSDYVYCLADGLYRQMGVEALANMVYHDQFWLLNMKSNNWKYGRMMRSEVYEQLQKKCSRNISNIERIDAYRLLDGNE